MLALSNEACDLLFTVTKVSSDIRIPEIGAQAVLKGILGIGGVGGDRISQIRCGVKKVRSEPKDLREPLVPPRLLALWGLTHGRSGVNGVRPA